MVLSHCQQDVQLQKICGILPAFHPVGWFEGVSVLDLSVRTLEYIDVSEPDNCVLDAGVPDH